MYRTIVALSFAILTFMSCAHSFAVESAQSFAAEPVQQVGDQTAPKLSVPSASPTESNQSQTNIIVAQQNICACTTLSGSTCSGACDLRGMPRGCFCKP